MPSLQLNRPHLLTLLFHQVHHRLLILKRHSHVLTRVDVSHRDLPPRARVAYCRLSRKPEGKLIGSDLWDGLRPRN